jgi:microcystin-dependent protein
MSSVIADSDFKRTNIQAITNALVLRNTRLVPPGSVEAFAGAVIPRGWLLCDGSLVSKSIYYHLYMIIGDRYGAGNADNFNLPDLRGKNIIGAGTGSGLSERNIAESGGEEKHELTVNELPAHTHTQIIQNGVQWTPTYAAIETGSNTSADEPIAVVNTGSTGGNQAHNVMDPFLVLNYIIKH